MKTTKTVRCIACLGKGRVPRPQNSSRVSDEQKREIMKLYRKGIGFREIARRLKIKSPYSVQYAIKTVNNV